MIVSVRPGPEVERRAAKRTVDGAADPEPPPGAITRLFALRLRCRAEPMAPRPAAPAW